MMARDDVLVSKTANGWIVRPSRFLVDHTEPRKDVFVFAYYDALELWLSRHFLYRSPRHEYKARKP